MNIGSGAHLVALVMNIRTNAYRLKGKFFDRDKRKCNFYLDHGMSGNGYLPAHQYISGVNKKIIHDFRLVIPEEFAFNKFYFDGLVRLVLNFKIAVIDILRI